ncbi:hypothetical protein RDI58_001355 [Solanum bulbocastanum]|uniref:Uncharacterized protein n=1 Tax=Solanum bulbocastanum TaxID=147425 RepID=A0AAN8UE79_SOLBU
MARFSPSKSL